jgi:activator of HSP90 ATPase
LSSETKSITQKVHIPATAQEVYRVLSNAPAHAAFSGAPASGEAKAGERFSFWGGQIVGKHLELQPGKRILQEWRPGNWPEGQAPTLLEFTFVEGADGTDVTMVHSRLPADQVEHFQAGWNERYWKPMKEYFQKK